MKFRKELNLNHAKGELQLYIQKENKIEKIKK